MSEFSQCIKAFNEMYRLPVLTVPVSARYATVQGQDQPTRLVNFKNILRKELDELDDILAMYGNDTDHLDIMTAVADLLGDIQVYCASEMAKWGIPQDDVLEIIMASNMSKLGADGLPIYDSEGKVQKGPFYWKPEPEIRMELASRINDAEAAAENG